MTVEKLNEWRDAWKKPVKIRFRKVKFRELVKTREGELFAYQDKDYMIEGIDGEQYPIKKDIFDKTYTLTNEVEALERKYDTQLTAFDELGVAFDDMKHERDALKEQLKHFSQDNVELTFQESEARFSKEYWKMKAEVLRNE